MKIKNLKSFAYKFLKDKSRKGLLPIMKELVQLTLYSKSFPVYYFSRRLYKKDVMNIKDYLPNNFYLRFSKVFNDSSSTDIVDNKLFFDFFFRRFNIPLPELLMYNYCTQFIIENDHKVIKGEKIFKEVIRSLFDRASTKSVFIKKSSGTSGGQDTFRISENEIDNDEKIKNIFSAVIKSSYIFQETVEQHPHLNRINSACINTIRIDTFIDKEDNIETISAYLRTALHEIHVDNTSAGGCFVGIDNFGRLKKYAYTSLLKSGGDIYEEHPLTRLKFEGFQIPYFQEVKDLVIKAASLIPALRLVGWDVAISKTGPVLIEGNKKYIIQGNELTYGGYRQNPVFKKALEEFSEITHNTNYI